MIEINLNFSHSITNINRSTKALYVKIIPYHNILFGVTNLAQLVNIKKKI